MNVIDKVNSRNHVMPWYNFFLVMLSQLDFKISKKKKKFKLRLQVSQKMHEVLLTVRQNIKKFVWKNFYN